MDPYSPEVSFQLDIAIVDQYQDKCLGTEEFVNYLDEMMAYLDTKDLSIFSYDQVMKTYNSSDLEQAFEISTECLFKLFSLHEKPSTAPTKECVYTDLKRMRKFPFSKYPRGIDPSVIDCWANNGKGTFSIDLFVEYHIGLVLIWDPITVQILIDSIDIMEDLLCSNHSEHLLIGYNVIEAFDSVVQNDSFEMPSYLNDIIEDWGTVQNYMNFIQSMVSDHFSDYQWKVHTIDGYLYISISDHEAPNISFSVAFPPTPALNSPCSIMIRCKIGDHVLTKDEFISISKMLKTQSSNDDYNSDVAHIKQCILAELNQ